MRICDFLWCNMQSSCVHGTRCIVFIWFIWSMRVCFNQHKFGEEKNPPEDLACCNNTQIWLVHNMWMENIWFAKVNVKTNISRALTKASSVLPVYQKTGLELNELFYDVYQTQLLGPLLCLGMHLHPGCSLDVTAPHLAFLRHKLSLLCHAHWRIHNYS